VLASQPNASSSIFLGGRNRRAKDTSLKKAKQLLFSGKKQYALSLEQRMAGGQLNKPLPIKVQHIALRSLSQENSWHLFKVFREENS
jgi:hypothetical protein